jgi:hypothetical protein
MIPDGVPDGALNSARARIMSGVAYLVERQTPYLARVTAEIAAELAPLLTGCRTNAPLT